jgi:hypothetical protein
VALSLAVTYVCAVILVALIALLPQMLRWYFAEYRIAPVLAVVTLRAFYACCPAGCAAIAALLRLLHNIRAGRVFTRQNVGLLRLLSWCCAYVSLASFVAAFWYIPFGLFFGAAGFLAVILRVVKNVMAQATALREENELTI